MSNPPLAGPVPLAVLALLTLSACASTGTGGPNGWAAGPDRPAPRAERAVPARPAPRSRPARPVAAPAGLVIPVAGVEGADLRDSFEASRSGGRTHHAIDIAAPTGTPVLAPTDGVVSRRHWNRLGGRTLYVTSADGRLDFYFAHLDTYADGVEIGTRVARGQVIGTVGSTGNARGPHLHLQVLDKRGRGRGTPVNPYGLFRDAVTL